MMRVAALAFALLALASVAHAEDRDFCADRPGKGSPPCVLDAGRFQAELGGVDAAFSRGGGVSVDDVSYGGLELRLGLTSTVSGAGDLGLGLRWSLQNPGGDGVSIAVQPYVTAPTGSNGIGSDLWQGGVIVPMSFPINADWSLSLLPQVEARENASGSGRHAGYALAGGVGRAVGPVNLGAELWVDRDEDPSGHVTQASFDLTAAWTPKALKDIQLDASAYVGLNRQTPDLELVVGVAHRF